MSTRIRLVEHVFNAAVRAVRADHVLNELHLDQIAPRPLDSYKRILLAGLGKASMAMAGVLEDRLGNRIEKGVAVVPKGYADTFPDALPRPQRMHVLEGAHPVPDATSELSAKTLLELAYEAGEGDLVIAPVSGGGTALTTYFSEGISLQEGQETVQMLLKAGADITAMNTVRKHISRFAGGRFARAILPADAVFLVISDVIGDDLSVIASGPGVEDPSTFEDAYRVLQQTKLWEEVAPSIRTHITSGMRGEREETVKPGELPAEHFKTHLLGTNTDATRAMKGAAEAQGLSVELVSDWMEGEARDAGRQMVELARSRLHNAGEGLVWGGETTVTVTGKGRGGRNQELVLAAGLALLPEEHLVVLSGGTDGIDGPTDAAGAWVDFEMMEIARQHGLDPQAYLDNNDAYHFFQKTGSLLQPGSTHTNVMDVMAVFRLLPTE